jgi:pyruvate dehydrogenase kinase 2/3/4
MKLTPRNCQSIAKILDFYSQFNPSPLSIKKFIDFDPSSHVLPHGRKSLFA